MQLVKLDNISKCYQIRYGEPLFSSLILHRLRKVKREPFWALKNISLEVSSGESVGIIGENGAGKSTLLRILTGVTSPTMGTTEVKGRIGSLLDLGAGFHPYLTGRENIFLNGTLLGMDKKRIKELFTQITDFADLGEFIDVPVNKYSNGMYLRLGFSIAVHLDTDILIVDEVLAVGDEEFQRKCLDKVIELISMGKSLVLVSHDLNLVRTVCKKVGWLNNGRLLDFGDPHRITSQYLLDVSRRQGMAILENFPLTIVFQKGKLLLFWHGIELTKNLCGYTSVFSMGSWEDSTQAKWDIRLSGNKISATGTWFKIPLIQTWEIELTDKDIIWQINQNVKEPLAIEHDTINLMLSENFNRWQLGAQKDEFPLEFSQNFWSKSISPETQKEYPSITLFPLDSLEGHFPKVSFNLNTGFHEYIGVVANTDSYYRARVIQYERKKVERLYLPEKDYRFSGTIRVG